MYLLTHTRFDHNSVISGTKYLLFEDSEKAKAFAVKVLDYFTSGNPGFNIETMDDQEGYSFEFNNPAFRDDNYVIEVRKVDFWNPETRADFWN